MKKLEIKKRVFNKGNKTEKISLSVQKPMFDGITEMAKLCGYTTPELICEVLEGYLNQCVEDGDLVLASQDESSFPEVNKSITATVKTKVS